MRELVAALRRDTNQADLPFFFVQIGNCFLQSEAELPQWHLVQETQRQLEAVLTPGGICSAIDLPLGDGIHIATTGQQRLGRRLAKMVRRNLYNDTSVRIGPRLAAVETDPHEPCLITLRFSSVNGRLLPVDRVAGFRVTAPGAERNLLCSARVSAEDPCCVKLTTVCPPPDGSKLWYGKGMTTFCNLVDQEDMAAPMFGPKALTGNRPARNATLARASEHSVAGGEDPPPPEALAGADGAGLSVPRPA
jgi:hypothetical protein